MSALEQKSKEVQERRSDERYLLTGTIPIYIGRVSGTLIDLSINGARFHHAGALRRGVTAPISFYWTGVRVSATAEILATRVISLGVVATFETRVRFTIVDPGSAALLATAIDTIGAGNIRRWVSNLRGWQDESEQSSAVPPRSTAFIRCRLRGSSWETKCTTDAKQPTDGFLLPAETSESEIRTLCATYAAAGEEDRQMMVLLASAVVASASETVERAERRISGPRPFLLR